MRYPPVKYDLSKVTQVIKFKCQKPLLLTISMLVNELDKQISKLITYLISSTFEN